MNRESDGERAVRAALDNLGIKYEPEKEIHFLKNDYKGSRRADFFLPKYNIYIEYFGGWDKKNDEERRTERARYNEKKEAYSNNGIKCIYIYPNQLNYVSSVIKKGIERLGNKVEPLLFYKNPLILSIVTAVLFLILSPLSYTILLMLLFVNVVLIIIFSVTRCSNCKRVFAKDHVSRDFEKIEKRPWEYRVETRYLYSDGSYKNSNYTEWRTRIERIKIFKNTKECIYCGYKWAEKEEENLDKATRPQTVYERKTGYRNPNTYRR